MRMQTGNTHSMTRSEALEFRQFVEGETEFRLRATGLDLVMMAAANSQIEAQFDIAAREQFTPVREWVQIVERNARAMCETGHVVHVRRKIHREQSRSTDWRR